MKELIKISDSSTLAKDIKSGAILNIDNEAYNAAISRKKNSKLLKSLSNKIIELEKRILVLEQRINNTNI